MVDKVIYSDDTRTMIPCFIPDCEEEANTYLKFVFIQSGGYSALSVRDLCMAHFVSLMDVGQHELRQILDPNPDPLDDQRLAFKICLETS